MKTSNIPAVDTTKIVTKIAELEAKIAEEQKKYTLEESQAATKEISELIDNLPKAGELSEEDKKDFQNKWHELHLVSELHNHTREVEGYKNTLTQDLMYVPTRYLITGKGENLFSPAGFSPEDRVFVKTEVAIMTDKLPKSGSNIQYFDMNQIK